MPLLPTIFESTLFQLVILLWVLSEVISGGIIPWLRRGGGDIKRKDSHSKLLISVSMYLSVLIAIFLAGNNIAMLPDWFFYPGIFLIVIGIIVRQWAIFILGRFFTTTVSVQKNQTVIDFGPYRSIRHPSYLGLFLIIIGMGIALQSLGGITVLLVVNVLTFGYRIQIEEKFLVSELGDNYIQYMKRTKRLIPFVF